MTTARREEKLANGTAERALTTRGRQVNVL